MSLSATTSLPQAPYRTSGAGAAPPPRRAPGAMTPVLVEREDELAVLRSALTAAGRDEGGFVLVSGPVGAGRTALLDAFADEVAGESVLLRANAAPVETQFAYGVVRQLFCPVRQPGVTAAVLADEPPGSVVGSAVLDGLLALTTKLGARRPVLLVIDDLQWTDEHSLRCLEYLAARAAALPLLIVASVSDGDHDLGRSGIDDLTWLADTALPLRPLSDAASAELGRRVLGAATDEVLAACHETAAGNPLVLTSILRGLRTEGARTTWHDRLRGRFLAELRRQPVQARAFATAMAILGEPAEPALAGRLAGLDENEAALAEHVLRTTGLLAPSSWAGPRFAHSTVRAAVDELFPLSAREELHLAAARLLHRHGHSPERIAAQLLAVSRPQGRWAVGALRTAAAAAAAQGHPEDAAGYLRRALLYSPPAGPGRAELLVDLANAEQGFDQAAALRHIVQAVPVLPTARERAAALLPFAPLALATAPESVVFLVRQAAGELGDFEKLTGQERELAMRLEARIRHPSQLGTDGGVDAGDRLALLTREPVRTRAELELLTVVLYEAAQQGQVTAARTVELANRLLAAAPDGHEGLPLLVSLLIAADSTAELAEWLQDALARARHLPEMYRQVRAQCALLWLHTGDFAGARAAALEAYELAAASPGGAGETVAGVLALVAMRTGELSLATDRLDLERERFRAGFTSPFWQLFTAMQAAEQGDLSRAIEHARECGRGLERGLWHHNGLVPWRVIIADLCLRAGDVEQASVVIAEDQRSAAAWGAPVSLGRALRIQAEIVGGRRGLTLLGEAVEVLRSSDSRIELALALVALGRGLATDGQPRQAAELLREGRELASACAAAKAEAQAMIGLCQLAVDGARAEELTATEDRVARLAAAGWTNHDIAELVRVTTRTVEKHLTKVYRKLGVAGRSGLPVALDNALAPPGSTALGDLIGGS
jgi:DNA-binding CsgD family transcriptional regulator